MLTVTSIKAVNVFCLYFFILPRILNGYGVKAWRAGFSCLRIRLIDGVLKTSDFYTAKGKAISLQTRTRPGVFSRLRFPGFLNSRHMKVVRLSALRTGHLKSPPRGNISGTHLCWNRDSSVGIATRYGLDGTGIESRSERDFPHLCRPAVRPTQPPTQ